MPIRIITSHMIASLLLSLSLFTSTITVAEEKSTFNVAEFHQILESINQANIPDNVKEQLFQDLKISMIENVRMAKIPEEVKRTLIKDLESTSR